MNNPDTTKTGVIYAVRYFSERWMKRILPPEHAIVAVKSDLDGAEYLISGPLMRDGDIRPVFTMHQIDQGIRLTGEIDGSIWTIGEWPSFEAFDAERKELQ